MRDALHGLTTEEARRRAEASGPNVLPREASRGAWRTFLEQLTSPLVLLLLGSCVVATLVGAVVDAIAIVVIVSINAVVGFVQEHRAERAMEALRGLTARRAVVVRDGGLTTIPASEVVEGDLLALEAGDVVAADARLVEAHQLATIEAALTGESMPVDKRVEPTDEDAALAEQFNRVFLGTSIATGTGRAVVESTAGRTQMGRIANMLREHVEGPTPLQKRLAELGRVLVVACVVLVALVAAIGAMRGMAWLDLLMTSVSLAVAAVPEGLPAVVTVALAVGVRRMSRVGVLVRRLSSVETLGCATVIATDKTGTLTTGIMSLRETWGEDRHALLDTAAACCDAEIGERTSEGDPTEVAILRAAAELGIDRATIEEERPRRQVFPFDPARRRMSIRRADGLLYVKGAVEELVPRCDRGTEGAADAAEALADRGLRVLAVARGEGMDSEGEDEENLELLGLVAIADTPRREAVDAIAAAHRAGIRVVMITGDHPRTARSIAREVGLLREGDDPDTVVHARATAADKSAIVEALQKRGEIVAMTGDGVNDAPSIRAADIGVAMGRTATEVTREASEMVLTGDDLSGIVAAVREGRIIYENIRKTVVYLLGGNASELVVMLVAAAAGMPLPLLPLHLLWINLVGEPLPGLMLSVDPPVGDVLERPPRPPKEPLLRRREWARILAMAVLQAAVVLAVYAWALPRYELEQARTLAFMTLVFGVILRALASRSVSEIVWESGPFANPGLVAVVALSAGVTAALPWIPGLNTVVAVVPLSGADLGLAAALGLIPVSAVEIGKLLRRRQLLRRPSAGAATPADPKPKSGPTLDS